MQCRRNFLTANSLVVAAAIATAVGSVFAAANAAQAQTVVHVRTADLKVSDTAHVRIEPVAHYGYGGGYYHSYYRAPNGYGYYGRPYRAYYAPYRGYYGGAYAAWYGNPYYAYPYYGYSLPYYGPSYYGSYYAPSYYGYPYSAYYAPVPSVGVYVGPRVGVAVRRGSFYW